MKVSPLIEYLKEFNPQANVSLKNSNDISLSYIGSNKETTKQIFIEDADFCESCLFNDGGGYCTEYKKRIEDIEECYQYLEDF